MRSASGYEAMGHSQKSSAALHVKDTTIAILEKRWRDACAVIDQIALRIGVDPDDAAPLLYIPSNDGSYLLDKLNEHFRSFTKQ